MSRPTPSQHSSFPPSSTPSPPSTTTEGLVLRGGAAHFLPGAGDRDANGGLGPAVRGLDLAIGQGQARGHGQAQGSGSGENGTIRRRSRYMEEEGGDRHERDGENHSQTTPSSSGVINEKTPLLGGGVDAGYRGDTTRGPAIGIYEPTEDSPSLAKDESAQRMYLAGPNNSSNSLFEPLRRPSPLQRNMSYSSTSSSSPYVVEPGLLNPENITISSLPSPAISLGSVDEPLLFRRGLSTSPSITSDSQAPWPSSAPTTQDLFTHPDVPEEFTYDSTPSRPRPRAYTLSHSAFGSYGVFPSTARDGTPLVAPTLSSRIRLFGLQAVANTASAGFLVLIVIWALSSRGIQASLRWVKGEKTIREKREWDDEEKWKKEKVVKDIQYYARECGFDIEEQIVTTKDGYLLKVFKVSVLPRSGTEKLGKLKRDGRKGFPVLIQHGLFQSCGSFITSEERSLAFWLAEHGDYQVYLGNNRGVFDMGHVQLSRGDPRFWDYNIKELALYDLPAMVDHIRRETGYDKIAFIGHSQGNATMFCSLAQGMVPELGEKLSIFIALAPAVYAGPLTTGFPFGALKSMKWRTWRKWFGVLDFIPLMRISYDYVPSTPFGLLGYQMFAFLFNWTDTNWLLRRKPKMFRFTPSPVSSASIFWWTGYNGFSTRGCVLDPTVDKWFDKRFPPLAIHYGGKDFLVLTDPLLARLKEHEKDVKVVRVQRIAEAEHCDHFWHIDAVEFCFQSFLEDIEKTRPRYPEEE